ncbi:hypothetical protein OF829_15020 [Sphingomonas sp. LB-2]|uniref:hypothetical protein n=1 Tax=Sphingomonas caeni TaxID=2984949 RepID=UPI00222F109A|nr:hypothetical protein [Sphingomonas caeni]MCW3848545.1 hypothetical protein [Sphingomonas caeni]
MSERQWPLSGMTVNERLSVTGLMDQWDVAVRARDRATMIDLMRKVEVEPPEPTVDSFLANPAPYGF